MSVSRLLSDDGFQDTVGLRKLVAHFKRTSEFVNQSLVSFADLIKKNNLIFYVGNESPVEKAMSYNEDELQGKWEIHQDIKTVVQKSEQELDYCIGKLENGDNDFRKLMTSYPLMKTNDGNFEPSLQTAIWQLRDLHHGIIGFMQHNGVPKFGEDLQLSQEAAPKSQTDLVNGILKKFGYVANELKFMADKLASLEIVSEEDEAIYSR